MISYQKTLFNHDNEKNDKIKLNHFFYKRRPIHGGLQMPALKYLVE